MTNSSELLVFPPFGNTWNIMLLNTHVTNVSVSKRPRYKNIDKFVTHDYSTLPVSSEGLQTLDLPICRTPIFVTSCLGLLQIK